MRENSGKVIKTIFTSGISFLLNCMISLLLTPYITKTVGAEAYGFVSLAGSFTQYAGIITIALNSFAARYIVVAYHKKDYNEANIYYSSTFFGDLFVGTAITAVLLTCTAFLDHLLKIPAELITDVKMIFLFSALSFWTTTVFTVFESSAYAVNKLDLVGIFKGISYIVECTVLVVCYATFRPDIYYVGCGAFGASIVIALSNFWIARRYTPGLVIRPAFYRGNALKKLVGSGVWASINQIGSLLNNGLDLLVCNLLLTPLDMGQLAISKTVNNIFGGVFAVVAQAFHPVFLRDYSKDNKDALLKDLKFAMKISGMFANILFAGFFALGTLFYFLWIPEQDIRTVFWLTVINNMVSIPGGPMQPLYYIYTLTLKNKVPTCITILGGLANVVSMYLLIEFGGRGVYTVVGTTVAVMCVINFITNPLYMAHVLELPKRTFYPEIVKNVISVGVLTGCFVCITKWINPQGWFGLIGVAVLLAMLGCVVHLGIVCTRKEKRYIMSLFKSIEEVFGSAEKRARRNKYELLCNFESTRWNELDSDGRLRTIKEFGKIAEREMGLKYHYPYLYEPLLEPSTVAMFIDNDKRRGYYLNKRIIGDGASTYNERIVLKNPRMEGMKTLETILHEIQHAKQSEKIRNLIVEDVNDYASTKMLELNFTTRFVTKNGFGTGYILPEAGDEQSYIMYLSQPSEYDANLASLRQMKAMAEYAREKGNDDLSIEIEFYMQRHEFFMQGELSEKYFSTNDLAYEISKCMEKYIDKKEGLIVNKKVEDKFLALAQNQYEKSRLMKIKIDNTIEKIVNCERKGGASYDR